MVIRWNVDGNGVWGAQISVDAGRTRFASLEQVDTGFQVRYGILIHQPALTIEQTGICATLPKAQLLAQQWAATDDGECGRSESSGTMLIWDLGKKGWKAKANGDDYEVRPFRGLWALTKYVSATRVRIPPNNLWKGEQHYMVVASVPEQLMDIAECDAYPSVNDSCVNQVLVLEPTI